MQQPGSTSTEDSSTQGGLCSEGDPERGTSEQRALGKGPGTKNNKWLISEHTQALSLGLCGSREDLKGEPKFLSDLDVSVDVTSLAFLC